MFAVQHLGVNALRGRPAPFSCVCERPDSRPTLPSKASFVHAELNFARIEGLVAAARENCPELGANVRAEEINDVVH